MTDQTDDDLFQSIEQPKIDDPEIKQPEPTAEEAFEKSFNEGVSQTLGAEQDDEPVAAKLIAGMSEDEIKALLDKARRVDELEERFTKLHDKAFGTIGNLKQNIDELRSRPGSQGVTPNFSKDTFKKLAEYFDDEGVAEALSGDLAGLQFQSASPGVDEDRLLQLEQKLEIRLLDHAHPDWREHYQSPEFQDWRKTLRPEAQEAIDKSWDGAAMARAFTNFKDWKTKRTVAAEGKQKRLESAITPAGAGRVAGQSVAAEDAFNQGVKKVISQRRR